jgi:hypothetical protein
VNKFDIIVSTDTIYNPENYERFYNILEKYLNNPGVCFICCKKFYFGVGGGSAQFIEYVNSRDYFTVEIKKEIDNSMSNIRHILEIRVKK